MVLLYKVRACGIICSLDNRETFFGAQKHLDALAITITTMTLLVF